jgi:DNA-binding transcriptional regulator YiaG
MMMTITGVQLKAASELIGLSQLALAVQFQLGLRTVIDFEVGRKPLSRQTLRHLKCALEAAGLEFANGRPSVRLRKVPQ